MPWTGFDQIAAGRDAVPLTREHLLAAIRVMSEATRSVMQNVIGRLSTGEFVVTNHSVIEMLDQVMDVFADLDSGKKHSALMPASHKANAARTTEQRKWDETLLHLVLTAKRKHRFRTFAQAAHFVARGLRARGETRDGVPITAEMLTQIKDYSRKRK
jgi:hypothetical protein